MNANTSTLIKLTNGFAPDVPLARVDELIRDVCSHADEEDKRERILLEGDIPSPVNPPSGCKFHTRCRYCQQKCKEEVPQWTNVGNDHYVACHFPLHKNNG